MCSALSSHCNTLQHTATHCNTLQQGCLVEVSQCVRRFFWVLRASARLNSARSLCVAVRCTVLQCVAVCCRVLYRNAQCVQHSLWVLALCCSALQSVAVHCRVLQCIAECCSALQSVAVHCRVLQCIAECCVVMQSSAVCSTLFLGPEGGSQTELSKSAVRRHNLV